jgi:hypothetical protein
MKNAREKLVYVVYYDESLSIMHFCPMHPQWTPLNLPIPSGAVAFKFCWFEETSRADLPLCLGVTGVFFVVDATLVAPLNGPKIPNLLLWGDPDGNIIGFPFGSGDVFLGPRRLAIAATRARKKIVARKKKPGKKRK